MTREELINGLKMLNAPNQGLSYQAGGIFRRGPKYDSETGERFPPDYRTAELTVHGSRAEFLYKLIQSGADLAAELSQ